jgi:menaquinone-dependent protoporphyrinogen oxidase
LTASIGRIHNKSMEHPMKILVGYATKHGSTRGIAERIAHTLGRSGHDVTLEAIDRAASVEGFDACVIGSAAYNLHWLPEASAFVRHHRDLLAARPVWVFSSGPVGPDRFDKKGRDQLVASRPREFEELEASIRPRGAQVFFGAWDPTAPAVGIIERLTAPLLQRITDLLPSGDFRDWVAIDAWAEGIGAELGAGDGAAAPGTNELAGARR